MSARDDYPWDHSGGSGAQRWPLETWRTMCDEIDRLRTELAKLEDNVVRDEAGNPIDFLQAATVLEVERSRWQSMAEDLWEELNQWHTDECPFPDSPLDTPIDVCTCHRILAAKWDEIGGAADWADDGVEA